MTLTALLKPVLLSLSTLSCSLFTFLFPAFCSEGLLLALENQSSQSCYCDSQSIRFRKGGCCESTYSNRTFHCLAVGHHLRYRMYSVQSGGSHRVRQGWAEKSSCPSTGGLSFSTSWASFGNVLCLLLLTSVSIFGCVHEFVGKPCCACDTWYALVVDACVLTGSHACRNTQIYTNICQLLSEPLEERSLSIFSDHPPPPKYPMADT